jgi:hypothetical protein
MRRKDETGNPERASPGYFRGSEYLSSKSSDPTMTALNTSCNPRNKNITG